MKIAIFSGELSGDLIGGALARELRKIDPDCTFWGLGSSSMHEAGVEILADSASWGAIGIIETLSKVPRMLTQISPLVKKALHERRPDVVVLIDFGAFNVRVARYCKQIGIKVLYYFPPGAWRRSGDNGAKLARITDVVATPFQWSADRFNRLGAHAVMVGHPLLERVKSEMSRNEFADQFGMDPTHPIIGLLPGSRKHEVIHNMPALLDAARLIYQKVPDAQFIIGVASSISEEMMAGYLSGHKELRERLSDIWHEFAQEAETKVWKPVARKASSLASAKTTGLVTVGGVVLPMEALDTEIKRQDRSDKEKSKALPPTVLAKGISYELMAHSNVLLTCSGTATLEAAIFTTPMVIMYRGSRLFELEYKLRGIKKYPFIGLPNILAGRMIVPELILQNATPEAIAEHGLQLLNDPECRQQARSDLKEVRASLGEPGASFKTAKLVMELARSK